MTEKISLLEIFSADTLEIKYEGIYFTKSVHVHIDGNKLYVTHPWDSNRVFLRLSEVLCDYFGLIGHDGKLEFLLRSDESEIRENFSEESIRLPSNSLISISGDSSSSHPSKVIRSYEDIMDAVDTKDISPDFFYISTSDYKLLAYAESLVNRAVSNVVKFLSGLHEYDCSNHHQIAPSIIGGVTKNGNDLTIVARPSDNNKVLLYYSSEYDVLEYVDAEFCCEDGVNSPQRITLGTLLKQTQINKIPVKKLIYSDEEVDQLLSLPRSDTYEYNATPLAPIKIAEIITSFLNTDGGMLVFGISENPVLSNRFVKVSGGFQIREIVNKGISMPSPTPKVHCDWVVKNEDNIFVVEVDKSEEDILLAGGKYIRKIDRGRRM